MLYVDDMLLASDDNEEIHNMKAQLNRQFEMKDLGSAKKISRMQINRNRTQRLLTLTQKGYVLKVLHRFSMTEAKPVQTPLANHFNLCASQSPQTEAEKKNSWNPYLMQALLVA